MTLGKVIGQSNYNFTPTKLLLNEHDDFFIDINKRSSPSLFSLNYNQHTYFNSNLPNLENQNGFYFPKGYGFISSLLMQYNNRHIVITAEPFIKRTTNYSIKLENKESAFSVLNDVPLEDENINRNEIFRNIGIKLSWLGYSLGYGNWNLWWGPGIHNSLTMSNNAKGFPYRFIGTFGDQKLLGNVFYNFKYIVSDNLQGNNGPEYYLSAYFVNFIYRNIEIGKSKHIINGGNIDIPWSKREAWNVMFTKKNINNWDQIIDYYVKVNFPSSGLIMFIEIGYPNHSNGYENDPKVSKDHTRGSNIGLRKYGVFGIKEILFGFEYTRLVQGIYYNSLPTPNWYDNIKYNYSSYKDRRWAAHSGSDSDDFLIFVGYKDEEKSFIYGLNYERHGVTYHFPPEVKFESRINASYKRGNTQIHIIYENEYFEHYGFVDVNRNVWDETFEPGSLQRTQTLLISLEHPLSF